jgi:hypothetical protein
MDAEYGGKWDTCALNEPRDHEEQADSPVCVSTASPCGVRIPMIKRFAEYETFS